MSIVTSIKSAILTVALFAGAIGTVEALEFKAIGANPAIMYDAPSERARKVFIAPRGMPLEIVLTYGQWSKVRDVAGDLCWVESKALISKRSVVVKAANAKVRAAPDDGAATVFSANRGVILDLTEPITSGWVKVRHRDGQTGYVKTNDVWGE